MDKISKYSQAIIEVLNSFASIKPGKPTAVSTQVVADTNNHHYLLMNVGWEGKKYIHHCIIHFDIIGDKVWLQQNWTDTLIADKLIELGVEKSDIVIGTDPEFIRPYNGFAVA